MTYQFRLRTDPGLARSNNEDAVAVDAAAGLAVLADGMGGYNAGEVASGMAAEFIKCELGSWLRGDGRHAQPNDVRRALEACVAQANEAVFSAASANPQFSGMGTTLVVAVCRPDRLTVGHIGDSRCYRLRGEQLEQITRDHSVLQEQLDAGLITPQEAAVSVHRNLVTRALGVEDAVPLEVGEHAVEPGDIFLLCSDGLSDMVADDDIARILCGAQALERKARLLVDEANCNGGRDNISVVLIHAQPS